MNLRRMAVLLSAGALAASLSMAAAGPAHAQVNPDPNWNEIVSQWDHNFNNTLCVDDTGHATAGTKLWLWHCSGTSNPNQRWHFVLGATTNLPYVNDYVIELDSTTSGSPLCINTDFIPGHRLFLGPCESESVWTMAGAPGTNPLMSLRSLYGDPALCMATADFSDNNGTPLIATTCNDSDQAQSWFLG